MTFAKGRSGNPLGARRRTLVSDAIALELNAVDPGSPDGFRRARLIARRLVDLAVDGDLEAARIVLDRVEGRVPQAVTGLVEGTIVVRWVDGMERAQVEEEPAP